MSPPLALINTYVRANDKPFIDVVSKIFIFMGLPVGVIRLPLLGNIHVGFTILAVMYSIMLVYFYSFLLSGIDSYLMSIIISVTYVQCIFYIIFNLVLIKRFNLYYKELNVFDIEVGCRPKIAQGTIKNFIVTVAMLLFTVATFILPHISHLTGILFDIGVVLLRSSYILEIHFCGHLLSLLTPRLQIINYYMEMSLSSCKIIKPPNIEKFRYLKSDSNRCVCKMEKVMSLYQNMIKAFNYLMDAVKWQLLVSILTTFIWTLCGWYKVSLSIIKGDGPPLTFMVVFVGLTVCLMVPLFAPCMLADQVHNQVRRLRELIALRLYDNQLDKSSRGVARALLALTETRDLSFSLLRMLNIDVSLPFKFVGLLVTYLIILLQFQKVINP